MPTFSMICPICACTYEYVCKTDRRQSFTRVCKDCEGSDLPSRLTTSHNTIRWDKDVGDKHVCRDCKHFQKDADYGNEWFKPCALGMVTPFIDAPNDDELVYCYDTCDQWEAADEADSDD